MKANHTLSLWDYSVNPSKIIVPGQILNIGGIECSFLGIGLDESAYFWLGPGDTRYMMNNELVTFKMAVLSCFEIKAKLANLKDK